MSLAYMLFGALFLLVANMIQHPLAAAIAGFGGLMIFIGCIDALKEGRRR